MNFCLCLRWRLTLLLGKRLFTSAPFLRQAISPLYYTFSSSHSHLPMLGFAPCSIHWPRLLSHTGTIQFWHHGLVLAATPQPQGAWRDTLRPPAGRGQQLLEGKLAHCLGAALERGSPRPGTGQHGRSTGAQLLLPSEGLHRQRLRPVRSSPPGWAWLCHVCLEVQALSSSFLRGGQVSADPEGFPSPTSFLPPPPKLMACPPSCLSICFPSTHTWP